MARLLRPLGVTMNFAPCVDLSDPGASSGIGDRAFGTDPERVTELAGLYVDALQGEGVAAVLKHFPGLGPTDADTHQSRPSTKKPVEDLWNEDMLPFRRLMDKAAGIMIGHAHYAMVDQDRDVAHTMLEGFTAHLGEAGVGSISEIFDAEAPFTPRGCIAQAWSVAEVLRAWVKTAPPV